MAGTAVGTGPRAPEPQIRATQHGAEMTELKILKIRLELTLLGLLPRDTVRGRARTDARLLSHGIR